jgi:plastocyanin
LRFKIEKAESVPMSDASKNCRRPEGARMKRTTGALAALLALMGLALTSGAIARVSVSGQASRASSPHRVVVGDDYFVRPSGHATVQIRKGQAVRWVWRGDGHNVTVLRGPRKFHSRTQFRGATFTHRFTTSGRYVIYCTVHGPAMSMAVKVN